MKIFNSNLMAVASTKDSTEKSKDWFPVFENYSNSPHCVRCKLRWAHSSTAWVKWRLLKRKLTESTPGTNFNQILKWTEAELCCEGILSKNSCKPPPQKNPKQNSKTLKALLIHSAASQNQLLQLYWINIVETLMWENRFQRWKWDNTRFFKSELSQTVVHLRNILQCDTLAQPTSSSLWDVLRPTTDGTSHLTNLRSWWFNQADDSTKHTDSDGCYSWWRVDRLSSCLRVCVCMWRGFVSTATARDQQLIQSWTHYLADCARANGTCERVKWINKVSFCSSLRK